MNGDGVDDAELVRRLGRGDERAIGALFDRHAKSVARYAWALAANPADAEEVVQDTFLTLWRRAREIRLYETSILPWLLVTCRYVAANAARRQERNRTVELPSEDSDAFASRIRVRRDEDEARDQLRWVLDEIERLEPIDRRVCELCLVEGFAYADAANMLGLTVGAVKQRVSRSRTRLRKAVTVDEI